MTDERYQAGLDDLSDSLEHTTTTSVEEWVRSLTFDAFNAIIKMRLDLIYPAPNFRADQYGVIWGGEHGGQDIDPGVRWATLLDLALQQLTESVK